MPTSAERPTLVTSAALRDWPLPRPTGSKHSRGHVLVVGGSPSTPGAAMLAGIAALRVGAGVLGLAVARSVAPAVAAALPEASVTGLPELDGDEPGDALAARLPGYGVILVGPGLDAPDDSRALLRQVVAESEADARFVLDAFALGVLDDSGVAADVAGRVLFTPNQSEAQRLVEDPDADLESADPADVARDIAARYRAVVTYQGVVADPDGRAWEVPAGHPGLGTSGSGDVLAGAVAGLLARGADPAQAACWATYLHAVAGERLAARVGRLGFLAGELATQLPVVLTETEA